MTCKTIIMCAVIGISMQNAWAMDKDDSWVNAFKANDALDALIAAKTKCDKECHRWTKVQEFKEVAPKFNAFMKVQGKFDQMTREEIVKHTLQADCLAQELEAALTKYQANKNNDKKE